MGWRCPPSPYAHCILPLWQLVTTRYTLAESVMDGVYLSPEQSSMLWLLTQLNKPWCSAAFLCDELEQLLGSHKLVAVARALHTLSQLNPLEKHRVVDAVDDLGELARALDLDARVGCLLQLFCVLAPMACVTNACLDTERGELCEVGTWRHGGHHGCLRTPVERKGRNSEDLPWRCHGSERRLVQWLWRVSMRGLTALQRHHHSSPVCWCGCATRASRRRRLLFAAAQGDKSAILSLGSFLFLLSESAVSFDDMPDMSESDSDSDDEAAAMDAEGGDQDADGAGDDDGDDDDGDDGESKAPPTPSTARGNKVSPLPPQGAAISRQDTAARVFADVTSPVDNILDQVVPRESSTRKAVQAWYEEDELSSGDTSPKAVARRLKIARRLSRFLQVRGVLRMSLSWP